MILEADARLCLAVAEVPRLRAETRAFDAVPAISMLGAAAIIDPDKAAISPFVRPAVFPRAPTRMITFDISPAVAGIKLAIWFV